MNNSALSESEKLKELTALLNSTRPDVRGNAAWVLREMNGSEPREILEAILRNDSSIFVRIIAHKSLLITGLRTHESTDVAILESLRKSFKSKFEMEVVWKEIFKVASDEPLTSKDIQDEFSRVSLESPYEEIRKQSERMADWIESVRANGEVEAAKQFLTQSPLRVFKYGDSYRLAQKALLRHKSPDLVPFLIEQGKKGNYSSRICWEVLYQMLAPEYDKAKRSGDTVQMRYIEAQLKEAGAEDYVQKLKRKR